MYIAPGHGHTTTWYKLWQHFKAFIISIILYQFQKNPFCHIILYDILFYFTYSPRAREKTLGDSCILWKQKGLITLTTDCMFQNNIFALWFYAHFFMILYIYIALTGADNPLGPNFWCQQEGLITLVICCKLKKRNSTSDVIHIISRFNKCI